MVISLCTDGAVSCAGRLRHAINPDSHAYTYTYANTYPHTHAYANT